MLIINADDWGSSQQITNCIKECTDRGMVDTVSTMVFMKDSHRAAEIALREGMDTALHINFTTPFDGNVESGRLKVSQSRITAYLKGSKMAQFVYNPLLKKDFDYVFKAQCDEYLRLYETLPSRLDGHNHMHLCANMLFGDLLPHDIRVRRNFSFTKGEKNILNRAYRSFVDKMLQKRYICTRYFIHIQQISKKNREQRRWLLRNLVINSQLNNVELLVHPHQNPDYDYLLSTEFSEAVAQIPRGNFSVCNSGRHS